METWHRRRVGTHPIDSLDLAADRNDEFRWQFEQRGVLFVENATTPCDGEFDRLLQTCDAVSIAVVESLDKMQQQGLSCCG